jgi:hypothetical protein
MDRMDQDGAAAGDVALATSENEKRSLPGEWRPGRPFPSPFPFPRSKRLRVVILFHPVHPVPAVRR